MPPPPEESQPPEKSGPAAPPRGDDIRMTIVETDEAPLDALRSTRVTSFLPAAEEAAEALGTQAASFARGSLLGSGTTETYRPRFRPPVAVLLLLDDNQRTGEAIRVRGERCEIGRTRGDIRLPHDEQVSSLHAEVRRTEREGHPVWQLRDLGSTNGTFVRVQRLRMRDGDEILLGAQRLRFEAGDAWAAGNAPPEGPPVSAPSALRECARGGPGFGIPLADEEIFLGRDAPGAPVVMQHDMWLEPRHCRVFRSPEGRWCLEDQGSLNGLWVRVTQVELTPRCTFQVGEQRIRLFVP